MMKRINRKVKWGMIGLTALSGACEGGPACLLFNTLWNGAQQQQIDQLQEGQEQQGLVNNIQQGQINRLATAEASETGVPSSTIVPAQETPEATAVSTAIATATVDHHNMVHLYDLPNVNPIRPVYAEGFNGGNSTDPNNVYFTANGNRESTDLGRYGEPSDIPNLSTILRNGIVYVQRPAITHPENNTPIIDVGLITQNGGTGLELKVVETTSSEYLGTVSDGTNNVDIYGRQFRIDAQGDLPTDRDTTVVLGATVNGQMSQAAQLELYSN